MTGNPDAWMDESSDVLFLKTPLPEDLLTTTWPVVCGFSLECRCWGLALVDSLKTISFHEEAFDSLVLPPARKRLLRALIVSHSQKNSPTDVLPGKGEGLILLLHGPPVSKNDRLGFSATHATNS